MRHRSPADGASSRRVHTQRQPTAAAPGAAAGAWNRRSALLFIDQPIGSGFSVAAKGRGLPTDEMTLAADLYSGLQAFFQRFPRLQQRPLVIAGESYAGE